MSRLANPKEERENTGGAAASSDNNDNGAPKERKGGLGRDKAARKFANATQEEREAANSDGKFGYYDMVNKRYVPAFFDAIDGGGQDTRGDFFKGGPLSGLLNKIMHPYGTLRERAFVAPNTSSAIQAAVQGGSGGGASPAVDQRNMDNVDAYNRSQADAGAQAALMSNIYDGTILPAGSGGLRNRRSGPPMPANALSPLMINQSLPTYDEVQDQVINVNPFAVGAGFLGEFEPSRVVADGNAASSPMPAPANMPNPRGNTPLLNAGAVLDTYGLVADRNLQRSDLGSQESNSPYPFISLRGGERMSRPDMPNPAALNANRPSATAMTAPTPAPADRNPQLAAFNQAMSTVPAMLKGTQIEEMYRDHLLNGGGGTFAQFTGAQ